VLVYIAVHQRGHLANVRAPIEHNAGGVFTVAAGAPRLLAVRLHGLGHCPMEDKAFRFKAFFIVIVLEKETVALVTPFLITVAS
jgi:hypothetical protein